MSHRPSDDEGEEPYTLLGEKRYRMTPDGVTSGVHISITRCKLTFV